MTKLELEELFEILDNYTTFQKLINHDIDYIIDYVLPAEKAKERIAEELKKNMR